MKLWTRNCVYNFGDLLVKSQHFILIKCIQSERKKNNDIYPYYNEYQFILNSDYLTSDEKVKALEKIKEIIDNELKEKLIYSIIKKWLGGLLEIGSAALPIGGAGKAGASIGGNLLKQTLGRKLSQEIGSGAFSGMASGAVFGAGQSLVEDKNPLELAIQYGASGLLIGGLTGGTAGYVEKSIKGNKLNNYNIEKIFGTGYKNYKNQAKNYYKDYVQDIIADNKDIGKLTFTRKGLDEIFSKNPELGTLFPRIVNDIKKANYIETTPLYKIRKDDIKKFHTLNNDNIEYLIAENAQKMKKLYLAKDKSTINQGLPSKEEGASINSASKYLNKAGKKPESQSLPNPIITDVAETLNPGFKLLPAWLSSLFLSKNQSNSAVLQENMPINIPVLKGGIQMDVNLDDLTNLVNREISKNTKIEEFPNHQYEMDEKTGIPVDYESGCFNGGTVYVNSYTRDDGTEVRGYYRSRPTRM